MLGNVIKRRITSTYVIPTHILPDGQECSRSSRKANHAEVEHDTSSSEEDSLVEMDLPVFDDHSMHFSFCDGQQYARAHCLEYSKVSFVNEKGFKIVKFVLKRTKFLCRCLVV